MGEELKGGNWQKNRSKQEIVSDLFIRHGSSTRCGGLVLVILPYFPRFHLGLWMV
jgi:hypothetical protein